MTLLIGKECVLLCIFTAIDIAIDCRGNIYNAHCKGYNIMGKKDLILSSWSKRFILGVFPRARQCSDQCLSLRSDVLPGVAYTD